MKKLTATLLAALTATAFAAGNPQEAQVSGSEAPKALAEAIHLAKTHGLTPVRAVEAQKSVNERAQAVAESIHLQRQHGNVNATADERMLRDAARL